MNKLIVTLTTALLLGTALLQSAPSSSTNSQQRKEFVCLDRSLDSQAGTHPVIVPVCRPITDAR